MNYRYIKRIAKSGLALSAVFLLVLSQCFISVNAGKYEKNEVKEDYLKTSAKVETLYSEAAVVMDAKTGAILFAKNPTKKEYPASTTKIMTSILGVENGNLSDVITYSDESIDSLEDGSSSIAVDYGEQLTLEQSLYGAMLESANECCNGIAEYVSGSVDNFAELMNKKADEIGCVNTHFANANGLYMDTHYTCAYDLAMITKYAMQNDTWRKITGTVTYQIPPTNKKDETRNLVNHHKLLNGNLSYSSELFTVEGGKTGYTVVAHSSIVTYAKSNTSDLELICVTMNDTEFGRINGMNYSRAYTDANNLLTYAFSNFDVISAGVDEDSIGDIDESNLNYVQLAYSMLQPEKFITFSSDEDCQVVVSNDYDASELEGSLKWANPSGEASGIWGTYEFNSGGNVIASTTVNYALNEDMISDFYTTVKSPEAHELLMKRLKYAGYGLAGVLILLFIIFLFKHFAIVDFFRSSSSDFSLGKSKSLDFKAMAPKPVKMKKQKMGYMYSKKLNNKHRPKKKKDLWF